MSLQPGTAAGIDSGEPLNAPIILCRDNMPAVRYLHCSINPLKPTVAMGTATKHPVPHRVKPSFVIYDILAL